MNKPTRQSLLNTIEFLQSRLEDDVTSAKGYPGHHEFLYIVNIEQHFGKDLEHTPISYFRNKDHAVQCALDEYGLIKHGGLFDMDITTVVVTVSILND